MRSDAALVCLCVAACSGDASRCPEGAREREAPLADGREFFCEQPGVGRVGPYRFESPTLKIFGEHVGGVRHGNWAWIPQPIPSPTPGGYRRYELGTVVQGDESLHGLRHGWSFHVHDSAFPYDPKIVAHEYECNRMIRTRTTRVDGHYEERPASGSFDPAKDAVGYDECMKKAAAVGAHPRHPLMPEPGPIEPGRAGGGF